MEMRESDWILTELTLSTNITQANRESNCFQVGSQDDRQSEGCCHAYEDVYTAVSGKPEYNTVIQVNSDKIIKNY